MNSTEIENYNPFANLTNKQLENIKLHPSSRFKIESDLDAEALKLTLIETIACTAMLLFVAPFLSSEDQYFAAGFTVLTLILSCGAKYVGAAYQKQEEKTFAGTTMANIANASSFLLARSPGNYVGTVLHELGHYLAIKYVDPSVQPVISVNANFNGAITYKNTPLIQQNALLITAGGPLADIAFSCACIAIAHLLKDKKNLCAFLYGSAALSIMRSQVYAASAFAYQNNQRHDYAFLWKEGGIHPIIPMINIVAFPLLTKLGLIAFDKYRETGDIPFIPAIHEKMRQLVAVITDEEDSKTKQL